MVWPNALGGDVIDEYKKAKTLFLQQYFLPHSAQVSPNPKICPDLAKQPWSLPLYFEMLRLCVPWSVACLLRTGTKPHSLCVPHAGMGLINKSNFEKERDGQKSPAPAYLVIVYSCERHGSRENPMPFAATRMDPEVGYTKSSKPDREIPCDYRL